MFKGGCFCGRIRYEAAGTPLKKQTVTARSVVEPPALRSSRGSACLGLSSGSCAVSLRGFTQLRRARGVSVLSAAHS
jgi:hypothetical protein